MVNEWFGYLGLLDLCENWVLVGGCPNPNKLTGSKSSNSILSREPAFLTFMESTVNRQFNQTCWINYSVQTAKRQFAEMSFHPLDLLKVMFVYFPTMVNHHFSRPFLGEYCGNFFPKH